MCIDKGITVEEAIEKFGLDPVNTGRRPRGWWIVEEIEFEEEIGNAKIGYLCVKSRDGASNPISVEAIQKVNCIGSSEDGIDRTYRYYYYRPLTEEERRAQ